MSIFKTAFRTDPHLFTRDSEQPQKSLISASFSGHSDKPPRDRNKSYKQGYRDGQELVFNLILAKRLEGCYVPVPPMPE